MAHPTLTHGHNKLKLFQSKSIGSFNDKYNYTYPSFYHVTALSNVSLKKEPLKKRLQFYQRYFTGDACYKMCQQQSVIKSIIQDGEDGKLHSFIIAMDILRQTTLIIQ